MVFHRLRLRGKYQTYKAQNRVRSRVPKLRRVPLLRNRVLDYPATPDRSGGVRFGPAYKLKPTSQ
jgi:hypothetical protein